MKVPRPFSIAGVSDMAPPRVRDGPVWLWRIVRAALGLFLQILGSHPRTSAAGREPPRPRTALRP
jgi:hypothetical protein